MAKAIRHHVALHHSELFGTLGRIQLGAETGEELLVGVTVYCSGRLGNLRNVQEIPVLECFPSSNEFTPR